MYYLTSEPSNSFEIIRSRSHHEDETLTLCAKNLPPQSSRNRMEITCYTGVMAQLEAGDRLSLYQIEKNRVIVLSPGFSHWGLVKLQDSQIQL